MTRVDESLRRTVESALLRVSNNVAKHIIQRDGWSEDDECFQIDLRSAVDEIESAVLSRLELMGKE